MGRTSGSIVVMVTASMIGGIQPASAGRMRVPTGPEAALKHVQLGSPTLPPMSYVLFCLRYKSECHSQRLLQGGPIQLTKERWADLQEVNRTVNLTIAPQRNERGLAGEEWIINPDRGDCNDYAVSKRHELLQRGWSAQTLLLSEVVVGSGEHHLVLVVRTRSGDFVLDNLTPVIKPWSQVSYRWVRIQMPNHSRLWAATADHVAAYPAAGSSSLHSVSGKSSR